MKRKHVQALLPYTDTHVATVVEWLNKVEMRKSYAEIAARSGGGWRKGATPRKVKAEVERLRKLLFAADPSKRLYWLATRKAAAFRLIIRLMSRHSDITLDWILAATPSHLAPFHLRRQAVSHIIDSSAALKNHVL